MSRQTFIDLSRQLGVMSEDEIIDMADERDRYLGERVSDTTIVDWSLWGRLMPIAEKLGYDNDMLDKFIILVYWDMERESGVRCITDKEIEANLRMNRFFLSTLEGNHE